MVLWRGILEERELSDSAPLEGVMTRVGYSEGYCVFYFVPRARRLGSEGDHSRETVRHGVSGYAITDPENL